MDPDSMSLLLLLPEELLLKIFEFCDIQALGRLSSTCHQLQYIIRNSKVLWLVKSRFLLGSNMWHPTMLKRCKPHLDPRTRCRLSKSWQNCHGLKTIAYKYEPCIPWVQLEANHVYCSTGSQFVKFRRDSSGDVTHFQKIALKLRVKTVDITKFTINENEIVVAFTDGLIGRLRKHDLKLIDNFIGHDDEILGLHARDDIIVSGSRDWTLKVFKTGPLSTELKLSKYMDAKVLSTAVMPSCRYFLAGFSGIHDVHPLQLFDLESGQCITEFGVKYVNGAGILDIYPENLNTFLCCGYDTTVRLWDIRCPRSCAIEWMDPYDNSIYCVSSDNNVTVVSGANRHGIVHIWDKRHTTLSQFMCQISSENSPVYGISFDASHIFASLQKGLLQYSFKCY